MKLYVKNGEFYNGSAIRTDDIIIENPTENDIFNADYIKIYVLQDGTKYEGLEIILNNEIIYYPTEHQLLEYGYSIKYIHKLTKLEYITGPITIYGNYISNPTEEILIQNGYIEYVQEELLITEEEILLNTINKKVEEIEEYDKSNAINNFIVNETINTWLTPAERTNYKASIEAAKLLEKENVSFYLDTLLITISVEKAERALAAILLYADSCFIVTKRHILNVKSLTSVEDINNYDFTQGYPEQLHFNIEY